MVGHGFRVFGAKTSSFDSPSLAQDDILRMSLNLLFILYFFAPIT